MMLRNAIQLGTLKNIIPFHLKIATKQPINIDSLVIEFTIEIVLLLNKTKVSLIPINTIKTVNKTESHFIELYFKNIKSKMGQIR